MGGLVVGQVGRNFVSASAGHCCSFKCNTLDSTTAPAGRFQAAKGTQSNDFVNV